MANEVLEHTPDHRDRGLIRTYSCVAESFLRGIVRLYQARIVFKGHEAFLIGLHTKQVDLSGIGDEAKRLLDMCRVSYAEYDSYSYLVEASMFVYGTTLFDTFLSDTTRFLYLANLDQLAEKGVQVPLREVVAKSRAAIINETVSAKSRKLASRPFSQRIETLDKRFRLKLTIPDATRRTLEHFSSIRNSFIHDQAVYDVTMNEDGEVQARRKTCPLHPRSSTVWWPDLARSRMPRQRNRQVRRISRPMCELT